MPPERIALEDIGEGEALGSGLIEKPLAVLPRITVYGGLIKLAQDIGLNDAKAKILPPECNLAEVFIKPGPTRCAKLWLSNPADDFDITNACLANMMFVLKAFAYLVQDHDILDAYSYAIRCFRQ